MSDKIYVINLVAAGVIHSAYVGKDSRELAIEKACGLLEDDLEIYEFQSGETEYNCILKFDSVTHDIPETFNNEDQQIVENHPAIKAIRKRINEYKISEVSTIDELDLVIDVIRRSASIGIEQELISLMVHRIPGCKRPLGSLDNLMENLKGFGLYMLITGYPNIGYGLYCLYKTAQYPELEGYKNLILNNPTHHLPFILRIDDYIEYITSHIDIDIFIDTIGFEPTGQTKNIIYALLDIAKLSNSDDWVISSDDTRIKIRVVNIAKK